MARRLPLGSVNIPDRQQPSGTNNKFIEPFRWEKRKITLNLTIFMKLHQLFRLFDRNYLVFHSFAQ